MKNKILKKTLAAVTGSLLILTLLAGCQSASPEDSSGSLGQKQSENQAGGEEPITLTLWHQWTTEEDGNKIAFDQVLAGFAEANPGIRLEVTGQSSSD